MMRNTGSRFLLEAIFLAFVFFLPVLEAYGDEGEPVVEVDIFESKHCESCVALKRGLFNELCKKYSNLKLNYFDLAEPRNFRLMTAILEKRGEELKEPPLPGHLPVVFIGEHMMQGKHEIEEKLEKTIGLYLKKGARALSRQVPIKGEMKIRGKRIYLAYFYNPGCPECELVEYMLNYLEDRFPNLEIRKFNARKPENARLYEAVQMLFEVPEEKRLITPAIFVGQNYFIKEIPHSKLESLLEQYSQTGTFPIWDEALKYTSKAQQSIIDRFRGLGLFTVFAAGLIDGVNPCAFATLIFLIVYLTSLGRRKDQILWSGIFFTAAVFISYFLIGLGLFAFLRLSGLFTYLRRVLLIAGGVFCLVFGVLNIRDFIVGRKYGIKSITLKLPLRLKSKIQVAVARRSRSSHLVLGAFALGFTVSLLEAVCTGQVYLPTILFVAQMAGNFRWKAYSFLALYNGAFILPLILVFCLISLGVTSARLAGAAERHILKSKMALGVLFFGLGALLMSLAI